MMWKRYEQRKSHQRLGKHIGSPDKPDFVRGHVRGEVKNRNSLLGERAKEKKIGPVLV